MFELSKADLELELGMSQLPILPIELEQNRMLFKIISTHRKEHRVSLHNQHGKTESWAYKIPTHPGKHGRLFFLLL